MFNVALVNLSADARNAAAGLDMVKFEKIPAPHLVALLEAFRELDPLENEADPEIRVLSAHGSFFIRTGRGRLYLYDARNLADPARELSVAGILAELDGSAITARTAVPFSMYATAEGLIPGEERARLVAAPVRGAPVIRLLACLVLLIIIFGLHYENAWWDDRPKLRPVERTEKVRLQASLAGVYMTGSEPGQHGIVVLENGGLRFFRLNAHIAPSVVYDDFTPGWLGDKLCLKTNQPGGLIEVTGPETLFYCGETYQRIP